jgi:hypothetical protein
VRRPTTRAGYLDADVEIRRGRAVFSRRGTATIGDGWLTLRKRNGEGIAQAPLRDIWADKSLGGAVRVWVEGERYTLEPVRHGPFRASQFDEAAGAAWRARQHRERRLFSQQFLEIVNQWGGQLGSF